MTDDKPGRLEVFTPENEAEMLAPKEEDGRPKLLEPEKAGRTRGQAWPAGDVRAGGRRRPAACACAGGGGWSRWRLEDKDNWQEVVAREEDAGRPEVVAPEDEACRPEVLGRAGQRPRKNVALQRLLLKYCGIGKKGRDKHGQRVSMERGIVTKNNQTAELTFNARGPTSRTRHEARVPGQVVGRDGGEVAVAGLPERLARKGRREEVAPGGGVPRR